MTNVAINVIIQFLSLSFSSGRFEVSLCTESFHPETCRFFYTRKADAIPCLYDIRTLYNKTTRLRVAQFFTFHLSINLYNRIAFWYPKEVHNQDEATWVQLKVKDSYKKSKSFLPMNHFLSVLWGVYGKTPHEKKTHHPTTRRKRSPTTNKNF